MYASNQLMFPPEAIPVLADLRGREWRELVQRVAALPETHPESLAFTLMMIRLDGCMQCEADSFRAIHGCAACARQTLRRFKRADEELLARYKAALRDVVGFLQMGPATKPPARRKLS